MNNMQISVAMNHADRISQELACARAFAGKHDPDLQFDVNYHLQAARLLLESLAQELGCTVERTADPARTLAYVDAGRPERRAEA